MEICYDKIHLFAIKTYDQTWDAKYISYVERYAS